MSLNPSSYADTPRDLRDRIARIQHQSYCVLFVFIGEPTSCRSHNRSSGLLTRAESTACPPNSIRSRWGHVEKIWELPEGAAGPCCSDGGGGSVGACFGAVSYTHLTLPTKRIV